LLRRYVRYVTDEYTNLESYLYLAVVMVSLEQNSYSVTEGQPMVLVCIEISGDLQRAVGVTLRTEEGTAQCEIVQ